jgi:hypothetical protein
MFDFMVKGHTLFATHLAYYSIDGMERPEYLKFQTISRRSYQHILKIKQLRSDAHHNEGIYIEYG